MAKNLFKCKQTLHQVHVVLATLHQTHGVLTIHYARNHTSLECTTSYSFIHSFLSDLSKDRVAPKGIACARVLPTTKNTEQYKYRTSYITNTTNKAKKKQSTKQKQIQNQINYSKSQNKLNYTNWV